MELVTFVLAVVYLVLVYVGFHLLYNLFFHPLRGFPGPILWRCTKLTHHFYNIVGWMDWKIVQFHEIYGEVVRFSPDELSFIDGRAWKDVYSFKSPSGAQMSKVTTRIPGATPDIITADDAQHARIRKSMQGGFTEKAMREYEPLISSCANTMVDQLRQRAAFNKSVDMLKWFNYFFFDVNGEMSFDTPLDSMKSETHHKWIDSVNVWFAQIPFIRLSWDFPLLAKVSMAFCSQEFLKARITHFEETRKVVHDRIQRGVVNYHDLTARMLEGPGGKDGLNQDEVTSTGRILVLAGSETTSTACAGITYYLLTNPNALDRVTKEVRGAFNTSEDMNPTSIYEKCPYLQACIEEGMRMHPPNPGVFLRRTPVDQPANVAGYTVPPNTKIGVHQLASGLCDLNFHRAKEFLPERWLASNLADDVDSPFHNDHRAARQPFQTGPRNCIGWLLAYKMMRVVLGRLIWNFDMQIKDQSIGWVHRRVYQLWEKRPLLAKLKQRNVGKNDAKEMM